MGVIGTTYRWAAALALIHVIAIVGGVGYLFQSGGVDLEKARAAVAALTNDSEAAEETEASSPDMIDAETGDFAAHSPEQQRVEDEIAWRNAERYRTQIEQRLKLINAARLEVDRRREEFERLKEQDRVQRQQRAQLESVAGYAKQVQLISALAPKAALAQIMAMDDVDATRILFELTTRKVKKIVEAAKSEIEKAKMTSVMALLPDIKSTNNPAAPGARGGG